MFRYIIILLLISSIKLLAQEKQDRPNILWLVSEDNSPLLGCYGDTFATSPNIDKFAAQGVLYENAFANAPVCAPSRSALITGMFSTTMGTEHMRSDYPIPKFIKFYPSYLKAAGYYTSNNAKKDYNTIDQPEVWDESSTNATYKNRKPGQPFFSIFNIAISHESNIHTSETSLKHDPEKVPIPPYHPRTPEMKHDWAQYYDKIEAMDEQVGKFLKELDEAGLSENTIVFYYSDHGGVLGRSKRFIYESGLHVPLIIRFPKKYAYLASSKAGSRTDRVVSFEDFAPTILSLAGVKVPEYMQGKPFLGKQQAPADEYAFAFRGRMDERIDFVRSIRDKKYRYVRNYMPHKIYGQRLNTLWLAPSMASWEREYKAGNLNKDQLRFWKVKPTEELYDVAIDPHNINNLADKKEYQSQLKKMRSDTRNIILKTRDTGFMPEAMKYQISKTGTIYNFVKSDAYPLVRILETAEMASSRDAGKLKELIKRLDDKNPIVKYWAVTGCIILGDKAKSAQPTLIKLLQDKEPAVRIAAAEAVYKFGEVNKALPVLMSTLSTDNLHSRVQALNILEDMGDDAKPALPAIKKLAILGLNKEKNLSILDERYDYDLRIANYLSKKYGH